MAIENDLTFLMTAKICHDLAAPLGALGMGLESLPQNDMTKMLYHSYFLSNFKLRYYRLLMTSSSRGPQVAEFVPLLNEYAKEQKINLIWTKTFLEMSESAIDAYIMRIVMGFVYLLIEPLVRGGDCTIDLTEDGLIITCQGPICPMREAYKKILQGEDIDINGRSVFPYFLRKLVEEGKYQLDFQESSNSLSVRIF